MVLVYPVISLKKFGHPGSAKNLLGENPAEEKMNLFSNELQVTSETPSAFLIHGNDDSKVPVENSINFFEALRANKIPAGIHLFASGQHGFPSGEAKYNYLRYCIDWINAKSWQPVK
jgi:dipeptidyl aminopeptidase/acylaminoacyl peptidase